ncbi:helix-turn-helix transcriptional regulator [Rugosimonospora acidiphila]|uniref:Helix-turn-helix transcriptional regulator n=1 Tax=Rugosimonospora acidiphila TaxID=556531 RepID=A0ABP9SIX8_9ACTN
MPDHQTAELLATISADPFAPMVVGIEAPGGYGKTATLDEMVEVYRQAGVEVIGAAEALGGAGEALGPVGGARFLVEDAVVAEGAVVVGGAGVVAGSAVVVVDDAHQLPEAQLVRLCRLAESPRARLVVAYRPWPRPAALRRLVETLRLRRPALLLAPLTTEQLAELLAERPEVGRGGPDRLALAESLRAQTGGVARYTQWAASSADGSWLVGGDLPGPVLLRFRHDFARLDADRQLYLLAAEAGAALHLDLLGALLGRGVDEVTEVAEAVRATGLLRHDGVLVPVVRRAIAVLFPVDRRVAVRRRLAELQLERGAPVLGLARSLLGTGVSGPGVASVFEAAAEEALPDEPALSAALFAAGASAGRPVRALAARWSHAAALAGDLGTALRMADEVIAGPRRPEQADCALVAAAALAHRGQLARSAELYRWSGGGPSAAFATVGQIGTGQLAGLPRNFDVEAPDAPPTLLSGAAALMARGVHESVGGSPTAALSSLVRASDLLEPAGPGVLLPDSPAALAALVGLHCAELTTAWSVLDRAVGARLGGTVMAARHRLLRAWILLVRGETAAARRCLPADRDKLHPRDSLFALALDVGLARRDSDLPALRQAWAAAGEAVLRHPVDLFTLLPLGELMVAAARLDDRAGTAAQFEDARALLARLGDPPLWSLPLHWSALHAAIISNRPELAEEHASALAAGAGHSRYAAAVAIAGQTWLAVLAGRVDPLQVSAAARGLHGLGLRWDASRLAGQAAIRTSDRTDMVALLDCARLLQGRPAGQRGTGRAPAPDAIEGTNLSERERQVADLVLAGMTYRQIGDQLYISPKTVEHHVARMRQRLGCASRSELLATLRTIRQPARSEAPEGAGGLDVPAPRDPAIPGSPAGRPGAADEAPAPH